MPYVNVKVAGSLSKEQKKKIAAAIAKTLKEVADKPENATYTTFEEIDRDNWAVGANLLSEN